LRSSASSLLALSVVAFALAGCGESTTHQADEVQRAFAAEGIELRGFSFDDLFPGRTPRSQDSLAYRIVHSVTTLASRRTERRLSFVDGNDDLIVGVAEDAFEAAHEFRAIDLGAFARMGLGYEREDNVLALYDVRDRDIVRRALDRLP
jgi:hypothetical protein